MSESLEFKMAAEEAVASVRRAVDSASARTALGQYEEALAEISNAGHHLDMVRRHLRLAAEAQARESLPRRG